MSSTTNSSSTGGKANTIGNRKLLKKEKAEEEEEEGEDEEDDDIGSSTSRTELERRTRGRRRTSSTTSKSSLSTSQRRITPSLLRPLLPDLTPPPAPSSFFEDEVGFVVVSNGDSESKSSSNVVAASTAGSTLKKNPNTNTKNNSKFLSRNFFLRLVTRKSVSDKNTIPSSTTTKCVGESTALRESFSIRQPQNTPLTSPSSTLANSEMMDGRRPDDNNDGDFSDRRPSQSGRKSAWIQMEEDINRQKTLVAQDPLRAVLQRLSETSAADDGKVKRRHFAPSSWVKNLCKSRRFENAKMEELYRQYFLNSNKTSMIAAILYATVLDLTLFCVYYATGQRSPIYGSLMVVLFVGLFVLLAVFSRLKSTNSLLYRIILLLTFLFLICLDFINVIFMKPYSAASNVWCVCLLIFLIYTMVPLPLNISLISGIAFGLIHFAAICWICFLQPSAIVTAQVRHEGRHSEEKSEEIIDNI